MPGLYFPDRTPLIYYPLPAQGQLSLGRNQTCDILLPDPQVSRLHARISCQKDKYLLRDFSRNGTRVNEKPLDHDCWQLLKPYDTINMGRFQFEFRLRRPRNKFSDLLTAHQDTHAIVGQSPLITKQLEEARLIAQKNFPVLICGETGTGKELLALLIHQTSPCNEGPFITVNCAALPPSLIESELFGHVKGAFTGAQDEKAGVFSSASGGTLFLDEVGEFPMNLQAKLLRVLEEKRFRPLGTHSTLPLKARIIAATNRDLSEEILQGHFREDLYHRLSVFSIKCPPLRKRLGDINLIAIHLLRQAGFQHEIREETFKSLKARHWPGNIRQLRNVLLRAAVLSVGSHLDEKTMDLPPIAPVKKPTSPKHSKPDLGSLQQTEEELITQHLLVNRWHRQKTALSLGISRSTLFHKMQKYGMQEP